MSGSSSFPEKEGSQESEIAEADRILPVARLELFGDRDASKVGGESSRSVSPAGDFIKLSITSCAIQLGRNSRSSEAAACSHYFSPAA